MIADNKPTIFEALLHQISNDFQQRDFHYFMLGLCANDALLSVFQKIKNKRTVEGKLYWVNDGTSPATFLDNRQIYVDISRI